MLRERFHAGSTVAEKKLFNLSMFLIPPVLQTVFLVGVHPRVDICAILRFEPLHSLSLGISRTLKECSIKNLSDETRTCTAMKYKYEKSKSFLAICTRALTSLNQFLCDTKKRTFRNEKRIDFSKGGLSEKSSGIFLESGLMRMIEGAN